MSAEATPAGSGWSRRRWLALVAGTAVVAAILLTVGVFALGPLVRALSAAPGPDAPAAVPPPPAPEPVRPLGTPPRPTATAVATAPDRPVAALSTGDCLQTYASPWEPGYPVVGCASPHLAEVLTEGDLPEPGGAPYPGSGAVRQEVEGRCTDERLLDWHWVAIWGEDVMTDLRYPVTSAQWDAGDRRYYCFVYTFSRHELTGDAVAR